MLKSSVIFFTLMLLQFLPKIIFSQTNSNIDSTLLALGKSHIGKPIGIFLILGKDSTVISNTSLSGKIVFINIWMKNCAPCYAEFEALNDLYSKFNKYSNFEFLSLTYESAKTVKELQLQYHLNYKIVSVKFPSLKPLKQGEGFPTNIVLDKDGTIRFWISGGHTNPKESKKFMVEKFHPIIETLLKIN